MNKYLTNICDLCIAEYVSRFSYFDENEANRTILTAFTDAMIIIPQLKEKEKDFNTYYEEISTYINDNLKLEIGRLKKF